MEPVAVAPVFVAEGPILRWLDPVFLTLAERVPIPARSLTGQWPPFDCTPEFLRAELIRRAEDRERTDDLWAAIVALTRQPGEAGRVWRLLACGLALRRLRQAGRSLHAANVHDRCDIHADLLQGFLDRLGRIDPTTPNVLNKLMNSARYRAKKQHDARRTHLPDDAALLVADPTATPGTGPHNWTEALDGIASDFAAAGRRLDPIGLELIARTLLDKESLTKAAAGLGLKPDAAYKRRARTEAAIAAFYSITVRRRASGRPKRASPRKASGEVSRGATADAA